MTANKTNIMLIGLMLATTALLAGCASNQQEENQYTATPSHFEQTVDVPAENNPATPEELAILQQQMAGSQETTTTTTTTATYPDGCISYDGYSETSGAPCGFAGSPDYQSPETRGDKLMPPPKDTEGYSYGYHYGSPMNADEVTDWITPAAGTSLNVNSAGKPFWVCGEAMPDSEIAGWCNHYYEFSYNAFEGWRWQGVASGEQRIQLRADWDDTVFYMTNVPIPPMQSCEFDCRG